MKEPHFVKQGRLYRAWPLLVLLLLPLLIGCQAKEAPLSPAAAAFKEEIQDCLDRLCQGVVAALVKGDRAGINEALKRIEPVALKLCRMCPFRLGVLDKNGNTLTVYPFKKEALGNFSDYGAVVQTMKNRKINQQRLFLQDGTQIYVICAPLLKGEKVQGVLVMSLSTEEANKRWGLTEREFMDIDFNQKIR